MSEAGEATWADDVEQTTEMPAIKLFGRWTTDDVQVSFVWTHSIRGVWIQFEADGIQRDYDHVITVNNQTGS